MTIEQAIINLRTKQGLTYAAIAGRLGVTRNQVAGILYRSGCTTDPEMSRRRSLSADFKNACAASAGTTKQVGKAWGVSDSSVSEWRRGLGVRKR